MSSAVVHVSVKGEEKAHHELPAEWTGRTVVVAIDDSESALNAFNFAVKNLLNPKDHLRLVHVQAMHEVMDVAVGAFAAVPIYSAGRVTEESIKVVTKFAKICKDLSIPSYKEDIILEDGSAGAALCKYVLALPQKSSADVQLVLGSRELGFFGRAFLGSVSEHCVRHCHCPVSVIKLSASSATEGAVAK